jgi:HSP20 family protein
MSHVTINKVNSKTNQNSSPILSEIAKRCEAVRQRAFDLFERRGRQPGHDFDDWLRAERELMGWPAAELTRKNGGYELEMTLPGFDAKEVEVIVAPQEVIVHAATEEKKEEKKNDVIWSEFGANEVYRRFEVPAPINVDKVTARLEKGLLRISAPTAAASRPSISA